ncbi:MAG: RNA methyltransferase [Bacteroidales bacterium]|jgi:TrmH family RNA methyltransferase|nr:RNA methyltransferase [Bacteroidales bacterium]MCU0409163.1 RNA methyltransferase [Bacteroidales bacterium]
MALSKTKTRNILALRNKKEREENRAFVVEGDKIVREFILSGHKIISLVAKPEFIGSIPARYIKETDEVIPVSFTELKSVSSLKTPHNAIAVVRMKNEEKDEKSILGRLCLALDFIQDPGNLGTIIRAAAWFGIDDIVCSETCVDVYNSKVIQASMGAILNVDVHYRDLRSFIGQAREKGLPVYATVLDGEPVYEARLETGGIIILGNESKGISPWLIEMASHRISIPKFTSADMGIESLNAGMAASVILSEFARRRG